MKEETIEGKVVVIHVLFAPQKKKIHMFYKEFVLYVT